MSKLIGFSPLDVNMKVHLGPLMDFGELNDKMIKELICLLKSYWAGIICELIYGIGLCVMQPDKGMYWRMTSNMQWEIETNGYEYL
jgi:hypothetical protein